MSWSQILHTELADVIMDNIMQNVDDIGLTYHNMNHVDYMYNYLAESGEDYDEALDWAVLAHDMVYDNQPDKEIRSAEQFMQLAKTFDGCVLGDQGKERVVKLITGTINHLVTEPYLSPIIRADLSALAVPLHAFRNYNLIMKESINLYDVDEYQFAEANLKYMKKLKTVVIENRTKDWQHQNFYAAVQRGVNMTINISKMLTGYHYGEI